MLAKKIAVGGTYEVRFAKGILAKAEIVREITDPTEMIPVDTRTTGHSIEEAKNETQFECKLAQRVGAYPKGHPFKIKARSVKRLVSLPDSLNGKAQEDPQDNGGGSDSVWRKKKTEPRYPGEGGMGEAYANMREMRQAPRQPKLDLHLKLTMPVADLPSVLALLEEYQPEVTKAHTTEE